MLRLHIVHGDEQPVRPYRFARADTEGTTGTAAATRRKSRRDTQPRHITGVSPLSLRPVHGGPVAPARFADSSGSTVRIPAPLLLPVPNSPASGRARAAPPAPLPALWYRPRPGRAFPPPAPSHGCLELPGQQQQFGAPLVPGARGPEDASPATAAVVSPRSRARKASPSAGRVSSSIGCSSASNDVRRGLLPRAGIRARRAQQFHRIGNITLKSRSWPRSASPSTELSADASVSARSSFPARAHPIATRRVECRHFLRRQDTAILGQAPLRLFHLSLVHQQPQQRT